MVKQKKVSRKELIVKFEEVKQAWNDVARNNAELVAQHRDLRDDHTRLEEDYMELYKEARLGVEAVTENSKLKRVIAGYELFTITIIALTMLHVAYIFLGRGAF